MPAKKTDTTEKETAKAPTKEEVSSPKRGTSQQSEKVHSESESDLSDKKAKLLELAKKLEGKVDDKEEKVDLKAIIVSCCFKLLEKNFEWLTNKIISKIKFNLNESMVKLRICENNWVFNYEYFGELNNFIVELLANLYVEWD